jgi:two-component system NarL family response regulator
MPTLRLAPAFIGYLLQFSLSLSVIVYLARRLRARENRNAQNAATLGFFILVAVFVNLIFFYATSFSASRLSAAYSVLTFGFLWATIIFLRQMPRASERSTVERLRADLEEMNERVAERAQELQSINDHLQIEISEREADEARLVQQQRKIAAAEEREQMARDLHDSFGQVIGYVNVQAQAIQTLLKKDQIGAAQENLQLLVQAAQGAHVDLRNYILGLRDAEKHQRSFFESLRTYLNAFSRAWGVETIFSPPQDTMPILPETVEDQILHIVQEALVNIRKHATARRVEVLMTFMAREIVFVISDDGCGFNPQNVPGVEQRRFGLSIMRERAEQIGGRLEVRSVVGQGSQVIAHIPRIFPSARNGVPAELLGLRILLVDDQPLFLEGMRNLLTARGLTVVGVARDGVQAFEQARVLRPDIALVNVQMPNGNGVAATRYIKAEFPEIKVALLTVSEDDENLLDAIKYGASGYFLKSADANEMFSMLGEMMRDESLIPPALAARLMAEFPHIDAAKHTANNDVGEDLTPRQWEILQLVADGMTYKEAAKALHISEATVKYHMAQILERLQLKNREQAVIYAQRMRLSRN